MDRDRGIWLCLMEWLKIWMKVLNLIQSHLKACRFSHRKYVKIVFYKDQAAEYGLVWLVFCYCVTHYYKLSSLEQPKFYHFAVSVSQESMWAWFGSLIRLSQGHSRRWSDWTLIWRLCREACFPAHSGFLENSVLVAVTLRALSSLDSANAIFLLETTWVPSHWLSPSSSH